MAFAAAVRLGGLFEWSGSVWPSVLAHAAVNFVNLLYLVRREPLEGEAASIDPE
jgi:membrane protease YdiL (CAAX protease family)